jgi:hypothetical protein
LPEEAETGTETLTDEAEAGTEAADEGAASQEADTTADTGGQTAGENVSAGDELTTENEAIEEAAEEEPTEEATEEESTEERSVQIAYEVVGGEYTGAGSTIKLTAVVNGYKEPSYQWQYDDGSGWKDIKGATDSVYMLDVTEENISYVWRVDVE